MNIMDVLAKYILKTLSGFIITAADLHLAPPNLQTYKCNETPADGCRFSFLFRHCVDAVIHHHDASKNHNEAFSKRFSEEPSTVFMEAPKSSSEVL